MKTGLENITPYEIEKKHGDYFTGALRPWHNTG